MPRDSRDEYDIEDFGGRMAKQSGGLTALNWPPTLPKWKPKKTGSHTIDIVPFFVTEAHMRFRPDLRNARLGKLYPERTYHTHRAVGVNSEVHSCPAQNFGLPCPICEDRIRLKARGDRESAELAYELRHKDRQLWLIWDNDDDGKGVQGWEEAVWNFGKNLVAYIEGARKGDVESYKRFYHPVEGYTMRLTATESAIGAKDGKKGGSNTSYTVHQFYPRDKPLPKDIINHGYDLDAMVRVLEYAQLKAIYQGMPDADDDAPDGRRVTPVDDRRPRDREEAPPRSRVPDRAEDRDEAPPRARPRDRDRDDDDVPRDPPARRRDRDDDPPARRAPEPAEPAFGSRDVISFEYQGDIVRADVIRVDAEKRMLDVTIEGQDKVRRVAFEDATLVRADDTFDAKPTRKAKPADDDDAPPPKKVDAAGKRKWDDDPDDGPAAPPRKAKPADDDAPPPKKRGGADADDDAPPKKRGR